MDLLCDNIVVEEILLRLPLASLLRLRAVSRRYNALILSPGFAARHWQLHSPYLSGGVLLRHARRRLQPDPPPGGGTTTDKESDACLLLATSSTTTPAEPAAFPTDIAGLLPRPNARETAYLQSTTGATDAATARSGVFVVHSSAGMLLCCRSPVHYYVCDPVARRCAPLPELPRPPAPGTQQSGLLSVAAAADEDAINLKQFQVILFGWDLTESNLDLEVFSSNTGGWTQMSIAYRADYFGRFQCFSPPFLSQSGTAAYWLGHWSAHAVVYSREDNSVRLIIVPRRRGHGATGVDVNGRCIGERRGGGLRYAHFDGPSFEVWDARPGTDPPQWTLKHRATVNSVVRRSPGVDAFFTTGSMLHWMAFNRGAYWRSVFELIGFDPADEDVFLFQAPQVGRVAAYSMKQHKLSFRCKLPPGVTFAPFDVLPYARQPRGAAQVPGMLSLENAQGTQDRSMHETNP